MADESRWYPFCDAEEHRGRAYVITVDPLNQMSAPHQKGMPHWAKRPRSYAKHDTNLLYTTLCHCGYAVQMANCRNKDKLSKLLREDAGQYDYSDFDSVMIVISGYGTEDTLYCDGGPMPLKRFIQDIFKADVCSTLAGKPKIVVLQLCDLDTYPVQGAEVCDAMVTDDPKDRLTTVTIPAEADFYFSISNIPGNLPGRKPEEGSLFFDKFCEILSSGPSPSLEINKVFTRVRQQIDVAMGANKETETIYQKSQHRLPFSEGTLTKQFKLLRAQ